MSSKETMASSTQRQLVVLIIFAVLSGSVTFYASAMFQKPIGADIIFHLEVADVYLKGQNGMFAQNVMNINGIPYPPLFHLLMLPSLAFGNVNLYLLALQALLYPVCMTLAVWLAMRFGNGTEHAVLVGLALLGSSAFADLTIQDRPESLDALLWLGMTFTFLSDKVKSALVIAIAGVYNHSFGSLLYNGGEILGTRKPKQILTVALASLPIIGVSLYYVYGFARKWFLVPASPQAYQFLNNFWPFTLFYLGALCLAVPIATIQLLTWKKQSRLNKLCLLTILTSALMIPIWYDRFYAYASLPLALLLGSYASQNRWLKWTAIPIFAFFIVVFYVGSLWYSNVLGAWDFH